MRSMRDMARALPAAAVPTRGKSRPRATPTSPATSPISTTSRRRRSRSKAMGTVQVIAAASLLGAGAAMLDALPANAFCSVHQRRPCILDYEFWIGQDLRLTIASHATHGQAVPDNPAAGHELNTLREMFAEFRRCWIPPPLGETPPGMQLTVRFALKRSGEIMATPRVTYSTPGTPPE